MLTRTLMVSNNLGMGDLAERTEFPTSLVVPVEAYEKSV